jgi:aspartate kinase
MTTSLAVLKFGGTSVGTGERLLNVASVVKQSTALFRPVVVVSAMSGQTKSLGTTSRLLEAVQEIITTNSTKYLEIVDEIEEAHVKAARDALGKDTEALGALAKSINAECTKLRSFMAAAEIIDEISPKSRDVIVSMGEKLSARVFSAILDAQVI